MGRCHTRVCVSETTASGRVSTAQSRDVADNKLFWAVLSLGNKLQFTMNVAVRSRKKMCSTLGKMIFSLKIKDRNKETLYPQKLKLHT